LPDDQDYVDGCEWGYEEGHLPIWDRDSNSDDGERGKENHDDLLDCDYV
jgi:hypothetical protein